MSDVRIRLDPPAERATWEVERDVVPKLEELGLDIDGPEPPIHERSAGPPAELPLILLTLALTAAALRDIDSIIEIVRKWVRRSRDEQAPKKIAKLYGPDGEVLAEIEQDD